MSSDEEQQRRSRVVVETPTSRREVVQQQVTRVPEKRGVSMGIVAAVAITAVALTALLFLFLSNRSDATNTNVNLTTQPTPLAGLAATPFPTPSPLPTIDPLPPVVMTMPPVTTQPGPVIVEVPSNSAMGSNVATAPTPTPTPDDGALQSQIRNRILADRELAASEVVVTVTGGTASLTGTVKSADARRRASKLATVRGVRTVDNQLTIAAPEPSDTPAPPTSRSTSTPATAATLPSSPHR